MLTRSKDAGRNSQKVSRRATYLFHVSNTQKKTRNQLGTSGGEDLSKRGPNFLNYVQHIFPGAPILTGLLRSGAFWQTYMVLTSEPEFSRKISLSDLVFHVAEVIKAKHEGTVKTFLCKKQEEAMETGP